MTRTPNTENKKIIKNTVRALQISSTSHVQRTDYTISNSSLSGETLSRTSRVFFFKRFNVANFSTNICTRIFAEIVKTKKKKKYDPTSSIFRRVIIRPVARRVTKSIMAVARGPIDWIRPRDINKIKNKQTLDVQRKTSTVVD